MYLETKKTFKVKAMCTFDEFILLLIKAIISDISSGYLNLILKKFVTILTPTYHEKA